MPLRLRSFGPIVFVALGIAVAAAVGFGIPDSVMTSVAKLTGSARLLPPSSLPTIRVPSSRWAQDVSVIPGAVREPLGGSTPLARTAELRQRPPLLIVTATIVVPPGHPGLHLAAAEVTLRDVTIITNGAPFTIETDALDATNSTVRAWAQDNTARKGRDAGTVRLTIHDAIRGVLLVDLSGEAGSDGAGGSAGPAGTPGATGIPARSRTAECLAPAGPGQPGRAGGPGLPGKNGGAGGNGGTLDIYAKRPLAAAGAITLLAAGGPGGVGGRGGVGGAGGPGGPGGTPAGVCFGSGPPGPTGLAGADGSPGEAGRRGAEGALRIHDLTALD